MFEEQNKVMGEGRQGEALMRESKSAGGNVRKLYLESYGCAMNFSDSEIVASIMGDAGFETVGAWEDADVIFLNTCAIRDNAEQRIWNKLKQFKAKKRKNP